MNKAQSILITLEVVFKDLQKLVSHSQQEKSYFKGCETNHFRFGILQNTNEKTLNQKEIAALIILLAHHRYR
ncbi:MAG: hypothetical protein ACJ71H_18435 [Nitrososphaeraceae archaeon]